MRRRGGIEIRLLTHAARRTWEHNDMLREHWSGRTPWPRNPAGPQAAADGGTECTYEHGKNKSSWNGRRRVCCVPFGLQAAAADGGTESAAVLLRNFPPEAGQAELAAFFGGFKLHANGLQLGYHGASSRTGQVS